MAGCLIAALFLFNDPGWRKMPFGSFRSGRTRGEIGVGPVGVWSMRVNHSDVGHRPSLKKRLGKYLATACMLGALSLGSWMGLGTPVKAGGETRTLSLYHIHTKESLTITYMVDGRYVPSAMKKINYLMRDWRRNSVIRIDPKTIDLMYELHADLGSKAPIHIVCGYRSPRTNSFLKRVGRNVAKHSQHMGGKAIDIYFPDVPTIKIRNSALARQVGGVGYYRSAGGPTGFLHIDSGNVRHWGPAISSRQWASVIRDGQKTIGRRFALNGGGNGGGGIYTAKMMAAAQKPVPQPVEVAYRGMDDEMAELTADAAAGPTLREPSKTTPLASLVLPKAKPAPAEAAPADVADVADASGVTKGYPVPIPRAKPVEILMMAAANMRIEPASAPPPNTIVRAKPSPVTNTAALIRPSSTVIDDPVMHVAPKADHGTTAVDVLAPETQAPVLRKAKAKPAPTLPAPMATASMNGADWWPELVFNPAQTVRRDGRLSLFADEAVAAPAAEAAPVAPLVVNRDGKGSLPE